MVFLCNDSVDGVFLQVTMLALSCPVQSVNLLISGVPKKESVEVFR